MGAVYTLDGIPSDVLEGILGDRKLKIAGTLKTTAPYSLDSLATKEFAYNQDGSIDTIITTDTVTLEKTQKKFNYNQDGTFLSIITTSV